MAHFVEINSDNVVIRGLVLDDKDTQDSEGNEIESIGANYLSDGLGGTWKKTSYNTHAGIHKLGGTPYRKNYAGKGYIFDETRDAFIPPKPFNSWVLNEESCIWEAPIKEPENGSHEWDESSQSWQEL